MKRLFVFLFLLTSNTGTAQADLWGFIVTPDAVFTQYYASPLSLNPAMTGVFDGAFRIAGNYRNQRSRTLGEYAYKTHSLGVDKKIKAGANNYFGIGLLGQTDVAGSLSYHATQGKLSFSYMHSVGQSEEETHYLIIGQDFGVTQRHIDLEKTRWPYQFDMNGVFDPRIPPMGIDFELPLNHFDMTTGIMWISQFEGHSSLYGGLVLHHVNKANVSFLNREELLSRRLTMHAGGEFGFNDKLSIVPSLAYHKQGINRLLNIGSGLRSYFSSVQNYAEVGINYLSGNRIEPVITPNGIEYDSESNAFGFYVRTRFKGYAFGLSYEQRISSELSIHNTRVRSIELSIGYIFGWDADSIGTMPRF